jgi:hypothetical protein
LILINNNWQTHFFAIKYLQVITQTLEQLEAGELQGAKQLKLSCQLTTFPEAIFSLSTTLEILDLSGNQLSELPNNLPQLSKLKILFLSDNLFTVFPEVLGKCTNITMIGFKNNQLQTISENALHKEIRWLILTNNQLKLLPNSLGNCYNMQKLALAGNQLSEIPTTLSACKNLGLLRISANQLTQFPTWLFTMPKLSWLAFAGNPFCYKPIIETNLSEIHWNNLSLQHQLGQGASGIISKAIWQKNNDESIEVAVKEFKGAITSDGLPEDEMNACILADNHKNLIPLLGKITNHAHKKEGLVLSLIPPNYTNLGLPPSFETCTRDVFTAGTVFTAQQIFCIAIAAASVGAHLHNKGILHGDLYAHNTLINNDAHCLLGDFGAASLYNINDVETATSLEKIEVLAWAYLVDDVLNLINTNDAALPQILALQQLKQTCMQDVVLSRPSFKNIVHQLQLLSN